MSYKVPNGSDGAENAGFTITTVFISNGNDKCSFPKEE